MYDLLNEKDVPEAYRFGAEPHYEDFALGSVMQLGLSNFSCMHVLDPVQRVVRYQTIAKFTPAYEYASASAFSPMVVEPPCPAEPCGVVRVSRIALPKALKDRPKLSDLGAVRDQLEACCACAKEAKDAAVLNDLKIEIKRAIDLCSTVYFGREEAAHAHGELSATCKAVAEATRVLAEVGCTLPQLEPLDFTKSVGIVRGIVDFLHSDDAVANAARLLELSRLYVLRYFFNAQVSGVLPHACLEIAELISFFLNLYGIKKAEITVSSHNLFLQLYVKCVKAGEEYASGGRDCDSLVQEIFAEFFGVTSDDSSVFAQSFHARVREYLVDAPDVSLL